MLKGKNMKANYKIVAVVVLIGLYGCKKEEPVTTIPAASEVAQAATDANAAIEQKICPVMGGAINKNIYIEHKGKKVYFCCPSCKGEFEKDPEKYIGKLPQFSK
jgi:YHS domain-containing protein